MATHVLLLPRGYQKFYTVKSITYIIFTLGNFEITKIKATKTSTLFMWGLGTSTKHCLFSELTKKSKISKHRMFSFALCTFLVQVKLNYCIKNCCHFWWKVFQHFLESLCGALAFNICRFFIK